MLLLGGLGGLNLFKCGAWRTAKSMGVFRPMSTGGPDFYNTDQ